MINELNRDQAIRYVTDLKGPLDGCRFEALHLPHQQLMVKLTDDKEGGVLGAVTFMIGSVSCGDKKWMNLVPVDPETKGIVAVWDEGTGTEKLYRASHKNELIMLSVWWLAERGFPKVVVGDLEFNQEEIDTIKCLLVGESPMEAFYNGERLDLHDNLSLKASCEPVTTTYADGETDGYWRVGIDLEEKDSYVGMLDGALHVMDDGKLKLVIGYWDSVWQEDDLRTDMLALVIRFLGNRFKNAELSVMYQEKTLGMEMADVAGRTEFWLGF